MGIWRKIFAPNGGRPKGKGHDFQPELRYCPACDAEYRPEITDCSSCGRQLTTGAERIAAWQRQEEERARRGRGITMHDPVVRLFTGTLSSLKASGLILSQSGIAFRIVAASCQGG